MVSEKSAKFRVLSLQRKKMRLKKQYSDAEIFTRRMLMGTKRTESQYSFSFCKSAFSFVFSLVFLDHVSFFVEYVYPAPPPIESEGGARIKLVYVYNSETKPFTFLLRCMDCGGRDG